MSQDSGAVSASIDLGQLLKSLQPTLLESEYVFCSLPRGRWSDLASLEPLALFQESEGTSVLIRRSLADSTGLSYDFVARGITLSVYSSLEAVGLTASVASVLAEHGIAANVIAAYHHDHVFVPADRAEAALRLLHGLTV